MTYARTEQEVRAAIDEIVRRIVAGFHPERIILFGSHARGTWGPNSDVDLLVVMNRVAGSRRQVATAIDLSLAGIPLAVDVVVATADEVERDRNRIGNIVRPAMREGRVVYERAA